MPDPDVETDSGLGIFDPTEEPVMDRADVDVMSGSGRPPELAEPPTPREGRPEAPLGVNPLMPQPGDFDDDPRPVAAPGPRDPLLIPPTDPRYGHHSYNFDGSERPFTMTEPVFGRLPVDIDPDTLALYSVEIAIVPDGHTTQQVNLDDVPPEIVVSVLRSLADRIERRPAQRIEKAAREPSPPEPQS